MTDKTNDNAIYCSTKSIQVQEKDGFCVLDMDGDICFETIETIRDVTLARMDKTGNTPIIINCEKLNFLDSGAVGFLVRAMKNAEEKNRLFVLAGLKNQPEIVLRMVGFLEHVKVYASYEKAKEYLNIQLGNLTSSSVIE